ncbi:MAG: outer membrane beta-barrel domain-containing protein [Polyangia bacterium]
MTKKAHTMKRGIALLVGCLVGIPALAQAAQERKSPLADAPAIRKRFELRANRLEAGVGLTQTIGQDFYNALMLNLRLGYHITDWIGISASAGLLNVTPNWRSAFNDQLNSNLSAATATPDAKTPTPANAAAAENRIGMVILPQVDLVPVTGKFSLFSKLFMNYDFYFVAGPSLINLVSKTPSGANLSAECHTDGTVQMCKAKPYTGMKFGGNVGFGMHAFVNKYFAINLEAHNLIFKNNAAGRDVNGNGNVNDFDLQWTYNWMVGLNAVFFLPAHVKVSH